MAKEKKATLVCKPCGTRVMVSDLGAAVVECWECGVELVPEKPLAAKKLVAAKKRLPAKAAAKPAPKKAATKKAAPKKKK